MGDPPSTFARLSMSLARLHLHKIPPSHTLCHCQYIPCSSPRRDSRLPSISRVDLLPRCLTTTTWRGVLALGARLDGRRVYGHPAEHDTPAFASLSWPICNGLHIAYTQRTIVNV